MQGVGKAIAGLEHRQATADVSVIGADGRPAADADVEITQTQHAFAFGNIGFDLQALALGKPEPGDEALAERWLELFNTATLPFYWAEFEPERGRPRTAELRALATWFTERGVACKGHPLAWHTLAPPWLVGVPLDEAEAAVRARITRDVGEFAGLVDAWDAINEVVIMPVYDRYDNVMTPIAHARGRIATIRLAVETARAANPHATLLLNDFDLSSAYECLIEGVLEAGIQIDAIGLQTHMHQGYWGEETMLAMVDRFARYGLPLHLTETSLVSGEPMPEEVVDLNDYQPAVWPSTPEGEARQADELARHYRSLFAHPAVAAIVYWGITDRGAWLGAPIGLLREDGSEKPSFGALRDLIKGEWWLAPTHARTDSEGRIQVTGTLGEYEVRVRGAAAPFTLAADGVAEAVLKG